MPKAKRVSTTSKPTRRAKRTTPVRPTETDPLLPTVDDIAVFGCLWPNGQWITMNLMSDGRYLDTVCFSRDAAIKLARTVIAVGSTFGQFTEEDLEQVAASARRIARKPRRRKNGATVTEAPAATAG